MTTFPSDPRNPNADPADTSNMMASRAEEALEAARREIDQEDA